MKFEWDAEKDRINKIKHGVSFNTAIHIFKDPKRIERYDIAHSTVEDRWICIGIASMQVLFVVFAVKEANGIYRIISARKANAREKQEYCQNNL